MKKLLSVLILLTLIAVALTGCAGKQETATPQTVIHFGTLPAEPAIPIIIAKEKGFFKEAGVEVDLVPFTSPNDRNVAVQAGQIDGILGDVMTALTFREAGFPMTITSDINEDFKLLTSPNSGVTTFAQLNNKDVSLVPNFVLEYIMDEMAAANQIDYEVMVIPSFAARFEALLADKITGVIFTEPQATMLKSRGAHQLASSKEYGIKAGTLLFNEQLIQKDPAAMRAFYQGYNQAVEYINTTDVAEYGQVLKTYGFPEAITQYLSGHVQYQPADQVTAETFQKVLQWTQNKGMVKKDYQFADVSNFSFLRD